MSRRLFVAALLGVLLFSTPALAGLTITDRQQATTDLATGPQFFAFGTGTDLTVGNATNWAGFTLEGLEIDTDTGNLVIGRAGDIAPSAIAWHDDASSTRACESEPAQNVRSVTFDVQREIDAGRLRSDLADLRAYAATDGTAVPFRVGSPTATSIVVDTTDASTSVCLYWGNPSAASLSDSSVQGPVIADEGWTWRVWENAGDGLSLDLVDWSSPSATGAVPTAAVPADVCNQCANELVGFVTPTVSGSYRFFLSADEVGQLAIAPADDPASLATIVELAAATPSGDFSDPAQASDLIELVADQPYAIRARSKDLEDGDHLEIAWALDGETAAILPTEVVSDAAGVAESLTHRRFDLVATTDRSGEPTSVTRIESTEKTPDSGDETANSISGYVVIPETGTYRFWISSDDEGTLRLATNGDPASASRVAWITSFTEPDNWTAADSQRSSAVELEAGQVIWIEAHNRDRGGPDHLQVGWSREDAEPPTTPALLPATVLSENPPTEAALPSSELGAIEGRQGSGGTFVSSAVDATPGGSNVFGLMTGQFTGDVSVEVSFSSDPAGPWSTPTALVVGQPAPLAADGQRYVRFSGSVDAADDGTATVVTLGVERDLNEAVSVDAATTVSLSSAALSADGDQAVLRVRGSVGSISSAEITNAQAGASTLSLASSTGNGLDSVAFGDGSSHHIVISIVPGDDTAGGRWSVLDAGGALVVHDVSVVVG